MMRMRAVSNTAAMPRKRADREPLRRRNRPADALRYAERTKATDDQIRRRPGSTRQATSRARDATAATTAATSFASRAMPKPFPHAPTADTTSSPNWKTDRTPGPAASPARCRPRRGRDDDENFCVRQESRGLVTGAAASDMPRTSDLHKRTRIAPSPHQTRE